ncbi:brassinosteroid-related acyltransferase 1 isoform X2 [Punica granatum]|uniref:Brassinosteroid-related acyltransferase 1 isoform X2 n=2 Tax=Punica granatum TaxID=22663 RepID=A0A6P8BNI5_PUNGR|nr:brassinosteroid-related acyltransferase 1 isoform X2 [Punica granatum]PKI43116.1 hypothetical protein CRG98_036495 [Punica granatum]
MATQHGNPMPNTVSIARTVSVHPKPTIQPPSKLLELSNLDRQCPALMYLVFFYTSPRRSSLGHVFDGLKSGLEETLNAWYPSAGRLRRDPKDGNKLNIRCNNEGAVMVEASTRVKIKELGELSEYTEFFENLVYKPPLADEDFSGMPLVVVQVTRFGCGGFSIGIGISHSLFDGPAAYNFLSAWSSNSAVSKEKKGIEVPLPVHDRGKLLFFTSQAQRDNPASGKKSPNQATTRATAIDHLYQLIMSTATDPNGSLSSTGCMRFVHKTFHLSGEALESLKKRCISEKKESFSCSSFEVVAAHIWKARTKALGIKKETMACLQFPVDVRNKMSLPLSRGFTGNAYVLASVMLTCKELEQSSYEGIARKIRAAKNSVNEEYVKAYIQALQGSQENNSLPPLKELTIVSDWTRMPFHRVDFLGEEAVYVSPLVPPVQQVACLMQNPRDNKGIDIRIGLFPHIVDAFSSYLTTLES